MPVPPEQRFGKVADLYDQHRPSYPREAIDWLAKLADLAPGAQVVDLGCGTGIAARLFAARGYEVTALDPSEEMLEKARAHGGAVRYVRAAAESSGLTERSVDLAYAAQAFHWFRLDPALRELQRILRRDARAAALWNVRAPGDAMDAYEALLLEESEEYAELERPEQTLVGICAHPAVRNIHEESFPNAQEFDWESFRGRVFSSSYVAHGVANLWAFEEKLQALFERYAVDGKLTFRYRTIVLAFKL